MYKVWTTKAGYKAVVRRTVFGHLCGYVCVPEGNSAHALSDIKCHGGITFARFNSEDYPMRGPDSSYWVGFDCGHYGVGDAVEPERFKKYFDEIGEKVSDWMMQFHCNGHVWTVDEVKAECESIAAQLKAMEHTA